MPGFYPESDSEYFSDDWNIDGKKLATLELSLTEAAN